MEVTTKTMEQRLQTLEDKVDHLTGLVESNLAWQGKLEDFVEEMNPVARAMMDSGIQELAGWEQRGYFQFGRDLAEAFGRAAESYEPGSLPELADSFGDLLMVLRLFSQAKVLAAAQDLAEEFGQAGSEPVEMLGAARRIETEKDLQRGLAMALDLFGTLGRSLSRSPRLRTSRTVPRVDRPQRSSKAAETSKTALAGPGQETNREEFVFVPDQEWNREWATEMATSLGVAPLTEEKWKIIAFSRKDYQDTKKAPNIRRITKALEISTKEIYALFPAAPGPTISKLAGVPKPAGCL